MLGYFHILSWTSVVGKGLESVLRDKMRIYFEGLSLIRNRKYSFSKKSNLGITDLFVCLFFKKTSKSSEMERENWSCKVKCFYFAGIEVLKI